MRTISSSKAEPKTQKGNLKKKLIKDVPTIWAAIPLSKLSHLIFAFDQFWTGNIGTTDLDLITSRIQEFPYYLWWDLNQDLSCFHSEYPKVTLFQYVGDLLLAAKNQEGCLEATTGFLRTLAQLGYQVSKKKSQLCTS